MEYKIAFFDYFKDLRIEDSEHKFIYCFGVFYFKKYTLLLLVKDFSELHSFTKAIYLSNLDHLFNSKVKDIIKNIEGLCFGNVYGYFNSKKKYEFDELNTNIIDLLSVSTKIIFNEISDRNKLFENFGYSKLEINDLDCFNYKIYKND